MTDTFPTQGQSTKVHEDSGLGPLLARVVMWQQATRPNPTTVDSTSPDE